MRVSVRVMAYKSEGGTHSPPAAEMLCPCHLLPSLHPIWLLPKRFFWTLSCSELFLFVCAASELQLEQQIIRITGLRQQTCPP